MLNMRYNCPITHSDRLYLRCTFCKDFVLLCRTNVNTRLFSDWLAVEAFLKQHLKCNPFYAMDNLCGVSGLEVIAWSDAGQEDEQTNNYTFTLPDDVLDLLSDDDI